MIRIVRGAEPRRLATSRAERLPKAQAHWASGDVEALRAAISSGYGYARKPLYLRQSSKCAYCERQIARKASSIDHVRPKGGVQQTTTDPLDTHRYWWLTWTWSNLLIACTGCNTGYKGNRYPIAPGTDRLPTPARDTLPIAAECLDFSAETPLLIDPAHEDPLDHICWMPVDTRLTDEDQWEWKPFERASSARGRSTIDLFGLDTAQQGLFDQVTFYIRTHILRDVRRYRQAPSAAAWRDLCDRYLTPTNPYVAAAWCALDRLVPAAQRCGEALPRPQTPAVANLWSAEARAEAV